MSSKPSHKLRDAKLDVLLLCVFTISGNRESLEQARHKYLLSTETLVLATMSVPLLSCRIPIILNTSFLALNLIGSIAGLSLWFLAKSAITS